MTYIYSPKPSFLESLIHKLNTSSLSNVVYSPSSSISYTLSPISGLSSPISVYTHPLGINSPKINIIENKIKSPVVPVATVAPVLNVKSTDSMGSITLTSPLSPISSSINLSYSRPSVGYYENLNVDPEIQKKIINYFYYKTLDEWLSNELSDVLNLLKIKDGKVVVIDNYNEYKSSSNDSNLVMEQKINYIEDNVLTKNMIKSLLNRIVSETNIEWVKLPKNSFLIKKHIENKLKKHLKKNIN